MNLGNWNRALLRSIFQSAALLIIFAYVLKTDLFSSVGDIEFPVPAVFLVIIQFVFYVSVFLLCSIVGWMLVGFPIHWLVSRYTNRSYFYYALMPAVFLFVSFFSSGPWLLGIVALAQALIFRFYVFQSSELDIGNK